MEGYTKLFGTILDSTIWREKHEVRIVWITMMAMADRDGIVNSSLPGLADRAKVTIDECLEALKIFSKPDKWSRSKDEEGRRIREIDGGWFLINYEKYRRLMDKEDQKAKAAVRQERYRERLKLPNKPSRAQKKMLKGGPLPGERAYVQAMENGASEAELDKLSEPKRR